MNNPLVSICCLAYNHKKYIRECLDEFILQKTNFAFEVLIHDDASTDGTADIIREYQAKYPEIIKPIYQTENQYSKGVKPSFTFNFPRARGTYIAMCEGDDYWTDPLKLQKQVDFLEANLSCIGYCHNFKTIDSNNKTLEESYIKYQDKKYTDTYDIIADASVATLTVVFRNIFDQNPLPNLAMKIGNGDKLLFSWLSTFGYFYANKNYIAAAYRKHSGGVWSLKPVKHIVQQSILTHEAMLTFLPAKYTGAVGRKLAGKRAILAVLIYKSNKKEFLEKYWCAIKTCFKYKAFKVFFSLHKKLVFK